MGLGSEVWLATRDRLAYDLLTMYIASSTGRSPNDTVRQGTIGTQDNDRTVSKAVVINTNGNSNTDHRVH